MNQIDCGVSCDDVNDDNEKMKFRKRCIFLFILSFAFILMMAPFYLVTLSHPGKMYSYKESPDDTKVQRSSGVITTNESHLLWKIRRLEEQNENLTNQLRMKEAEKCLTGPGLSRCEVIHIAIVCGKFNSTRDLVTLLKSLLFYRKNRLHFHFFSDATATKILKVLFETWLVPAVEVTFYAADDLKGEVEWIPNKHYSGVYGLMKLLLPERLPSHLDKVIVLDTDITFATDVGELWKLFRGFEIGQAVGLVENQSEWYLGKLWTDHRPWPAQGRGYNTGVILLDLRVLRSLKWILLWTRVAKRVLKDLLWTSLADQDIFNVVIKENPFLVHILPCQWNVQLSENTLSDQCYTEVSDLKVIHWNSPKKLKVKNKHVEYFRNLFLTFLEYNGNLLRQEFLVDCDSDKFSSSISSSSSSPSLSSPSSSPSLSADHLSNINDFIKQQQQSILEGVADEEGECYDFYREKLIVRRIHLYYIQYSEGLMSLSSLPSSSSSSTSVLLHLPYSLSSSSSSSSPLKSQRSNDDNNGGSNDIIKDNFNFVHQNHLSSPPSSSTTPPSDVDITLVAQLSTDRLQMLEMVASVWQGPISIALYMSDAEVYQFLRFIQGSSILAPRKNIGCHVVYKDGQYYPINYLRNVAFNQVNTQFAFLTDIDFLPVVDLYEKIKQHIIDLDLINKKRALVIPAFETERYKAEYPSSKSELLTMLNDGNLFTFRYHVWPQGQATTDYDRWKNANEPYQVSWEPNYEPFIVIDRSAPKYDERFLGFGWNKVSHIMEVDAQGYEFWVVPDSFILHLPHSPSIDIARYRSSESYRYCLRLLKDEFLRDLSRRYGLRALKYLSPDN